MATATPRYLFGDGDLAARRLQKLSEVFEPWSATFLRANAKPDSALVYDLGCGPGFTTHLVARELRAENTIGLENAERFHELASAHASGGISFRLHDITTTPFPAGKASAIYGRFILSHLPNAEALVQAWCTQLDSGGRLLLEEVEWIETGVAPFRQYLDTVEAMLANNGSQLYAGRALDSLGTRGLNVVRNERVEFDVPDRDTAAMFVPNIATWKTETFITERHGPGEIDALEGELQARLKSPAGQSGIRWIMRQTVLEQG